MYVQTLFVLFGVMENKTSKYCDCLYHSVNALSRVLTKMADEEFTVTGLTSSYALLLMSVNEKPGIQPKEISREMQLTPSTVTRLIEKLEMKGLVERSNSGRCTLVYPTQLGINKQESIKDAWASLHNRYSELLGKEKTNLLTSEVGSSIQLLGVNPECRINN